MQVQDLVRVEYKDETETRELLNSLCYANNSNGTFLGKVLKSLNFTDNFEQYFADLDVENATKVTARHKLGNKPSQYVFVNSYRIDRFEIGTLNNNTVDLTFYLKNTFLTANVASSKDCYVGNTNIFKVGDVVKLGSLSTSVEAIDSSTRKITLKDTVTSANQFDTLQLFSDKIQIVVI